MSQPSKPNPQGGDRTFSVVQARCVWDCRRGEPTRAPRGTSPACNHDHTHHTLTVGPGLVPMHGVGGHRFSHPSPFPNLPPSWAPCHDVTWRSNRGVVGGKLGCPGWCVIPCGLPEQPHFRLANANHWWSWGGPCVDRTVPCNGATFGCAGCCVRSGRSTMQSAARAIARIAAQRQQPWPRLQQCIWTQVRLARTP